MKRAVVITALTKNERGFPVTSTRPYGALLVANTPLLLHQLRAMGGASSVVLIATAENLSALGKLANDRLAEPVTLIDVAELDDVANALATASYLLPGDLLPLDALTPEGRLLLIEAKHESEEGGAAKALLATLGLDDTPRLVVDALRLNYPWELLSANERVLEATVRENVLARDAVIEPGVTMKGAVHIGSGTVVKTGSYLEGPISLGAGCEIGPFCHLRPHTSIADGCRLGKTEVVDCVLFPNSTSKHVAYLGHSVVGEGVNIGAFTVTSDYRHDGGVHRTFVGERKVDTGRKKVGAFLGDNVRTGVGTLFYPGRKLWPRMTTLPGEIVTHDKRGE